MIEHDDVLERVFESMAGLRGRPRRMLRHALRCPECTELLRQALAEGELAPPAGGGRTASAGGADAGPLLRRLDGERPGLLADLGRRAAEAEELFARLMAAPAARREALARTRPFRSLPLAFRLLVASDRAQPRDPEASGGLARLALAVAGQLYGAGELAVVHEAKVRAHALAGNARRLQGDCDGAAEQLRQAVPYLQPRDASHRAFYCRHLAFLRLEQGHAEEAAALLSQAAAIYQRCGELEESGECRLHSGLLCLERGQVVRASEALTSACGGLDPERSPALAARARMALALCHARLGRRARAQGLAAATRPLYERIGGGEDLKAVLRLEGRLAKALHLDPLAVALDSQVLPGS